MVFYIHEQGARISTPVKSLFKPGGVAAVARSNELQRIGNNQKVEDPQESIAQKQSKYPVRQEQEQERDKAIYANQIMSSPVRVLEQDQLVADAAKIFLSAPYHHLPIVDQQRKLCGILSDRDIMRADPARLLIREIMTQRVITAAANTEIKLIAEVMVQLRIGAMPVVDEASQVLGIVTRTDILRTVVDAPLDLWT